MDKKNLELIQHEVTPYGFKNSKTVAMGNNYAILKHYCIKNFNQEPIEDGHKINEGINIVYTIKESNIPIII